jgi:hypothetical protein
MEQGAVPTQRAKSSVLKFLQQVVGGHQLVGAVK